MEKRIHIRIPELLKENGVSKTKLCKDLNLQHGNLNKYCRDEFQHINAALIVKLCNYFKCDISDLLEIIEVPDSSEEAENNKVFFTPIYRNSNR